MSIDPSQMIGHETIRARLKRAMNRAFSGGFIIGIIGWLLIAWIVKPRGWTQGWRANQSLPPHDQLVLAFSHFVLLAALLGWLYAATRFRCPRCKAVFGYFFGMRASGFMRMPRRTDSPPDKCPHCGVNLDEQWPE